MKKVAALLCVLFVLASTCFAEETSDYSCLDGMGVEELMALRTEIDSRLAQEGVYEANLIPSGIYIVGTDIKAGVYTLKHLYSQSSYDDTAAIGVFDNFEDANKGENPIVFEWLSIGGEKIIRLEDGQCFYNMGTTLYIFDAASDEVKKSWQP